MPDHGWVILFDLARCKECTTSTPAEAPPCLQSCAVAHHLPPRLRPAGTFAPPVCPQCVDAPCASACPVDAITQSRQGVVLVDQELCIGCRFCVDVCPVAGLIYVDPGAVAAPSHPLPDYSNDRPEGRLPNTVVKCTFCSDRLLDGELPACAQGCPSAAIYVGSLDLNTVTNGGMVDRLDTLLARHQHTVRPGSAGGGTRIVDLV